MKKHPCVGSIICHISDSKRWFGIGTFDGTCELEPDELVTITGEWEEFFIICHENRFYMTYKSTVRKYFYEIHEKNFES